MMLFFVLNLIPRACLDTTMSANAAGVAPPACPDEDAPSLLLLLPPLWGIVAGYFDASEKWYLANMPMFRFSVAQTSFTVQDLDALAFKFDNPLVLGVLRARALAHFRPSDVGRAIEADRVGVLSWLVRTERVKTRTYRKYGCHSGRHGSLRVLMWERQTGILPWTAGTATALISGNHNDVLRQLRAASPPCPWDNEAYRLAVYSGDVELVKWIESDLPDAEMPELCYISTNHMLGYFASHEKFSKGLLEDVLHFAWSDFLLYILDNHYELAAKIANDIVGLAANGYSAIGGRVRDMTDLLIGRGFPLPPPSYRCNRSNGRACLVRLGWVEG